MTVAEMTQSYAAMGPSVADPSTDGLTDKLTAQVRWRAAIGRQVAR